MVLSRESSRRGSVSEVAREVSRRLIRRRFQVAWTSWLKSRCSVAPSGLCSAVRHHGLDNPSEGRLGGDAVREHEGQLLCGVVAHESTTRQVASGGYAPTGPNCLPDSCRLRELLVLISQYSVLAGDAADLHSGWSGLARDYERLCIHLDDPQAETKFHQIYECGGIALQDGSEVPVQGQASRILARPRRWWSGLAPKWVDPCGISSPSTTHRCMEVG